jgi:DnaJ family protein A protein 2
VFLPVRSAGGDEHKFKEINAAYEILSDPEKRSKYDKYGLEGVDDESGAAARGEDLFSMFFGGRGRGGGRGGGGGPRKGPAVNHPIKVSLEDLYNGKTVKLAINRKVVVGEVTECSACHGQGVRLEIRQIAPGMITQMQRHCDRCEGQGKIAQTRSERKVLEVHIEKGMANGEKVVFRNHADEVPGMEAGDVNFVIQEKPHDMFKRKGADLLTTRTVSLNQALCGYSVREAPEAGFGGFSFFPLLVSRGIGSDTHPFLALPAQCAVNLIFAVRKTVAVQAPGRPRRHCQDETGTDHPVRDD